MKIKVYYKNDKFLFVLLYALFFLLVYVSKKGFILSMLCTLAIVLYLFFKLNKSKDITNILLLPIFLSIFQNTYLGYLSPSLGKNNLQFFTILNFLIACIFFIMLIIVNKNNNDYNKHIFIYLGILVLYSFVSLIFSSNFNLLSSLSSIRNIISIFLFLLIGELAYSKTNIEKFDRLLMFFGVIVIVFGLYEVFINTDIWRSLNITTLWQKKGIALQQSGLPTNFFSSETINGERIRRMASTFADPVNLGSFLFALFCISWYFKKRIMCGLSLISIVLTVSKGAFLGILVFILIYYIFKKGNKNIILVGVPVLSIGILFLMYAYKTSSNSVFVHISGFVAAFKALVHNPLGSGLGSTGVLASQFSGMTSNTEIIETGLGMIIGQLGLIGLTIFVLFFITVFKEIKLVKNINDKILCLTLFISIVINILFNEVALSPNSCAIYFIIIGYIISKSKIERKQINEGHS